MAATTPKVLIAVVSAAIAAGVAWIVVGGLPGGADDMGNADVELVDSNAALEEAFRERDEAALTAESHGADSEAGLPRIRIGPRIAGILHPSIGISQVYHPVMLARHTPDLNQRFRMKEHPLGFWTMHTNSLGMREDAEPAEEQPDLRVLIVGDSHVDGVCNNDESFASRLEQMLSERHPDRSIEVLNAGTGGWSFYNYLGAIEAYAELAPDVFVVTVYGGNDFHGALDLHHYHRGEKLKPSHAPTVGALVRLGKERITGISAQFYGQVVYFDTYPAEVAAARKMSRDVTLAIGERCDKLGAKLLCVYLPPYADVDPVAYAEDLEAARAAVEVKDQSLGVSDHLATRWLADLEQNGVRAVDMRPVFLPLIDAGEPLYWRKDHHINLTAQDSVAQAILEPVEELAGLR